MWSFFFNIIPEIKKNSNYNIIILDLETTGLSVSKSGIVEISCYSSSYDTQITSYFNPEVENIKILWNNSAFNINKINFKTVSDSPSINSFFQDFDSWATVNETKTPIILAHNSKFDERFFTYWRKEFILEQKNYIWYDTIPIFKEATKKKVNKSLKLELLYEEFLKNENKDLVLHGAEVDVFVLKNLLIKVFGSIDIIEKYFVSKLEKKECDVKIKKLVSSNNEKK